VRRPRDSRAEHPPAHARRDLPGPHPQARPGPDGPGGSGRPDGPDGSEPVMTSGPLIPVAATAGTGQPARPLAGIVRAGLARSAVELKAFFRNRQSLVFSLLFPVLLLVIFGSIFGGTVPGTGTSYKQVFMAGIIAAGVMSVAFSNLAINISLER